MTVTWTNDTVLQLIEYFHSNALLWDPTHKDRKNRQKKHEAFEEIASALNISKHDVENKIHVLRTQFVRERKRMFAKKTDECKWMYYEPLQFLLQGTTTSFGEWSTMNQSTHSSEPEEKDKTIKMQIWSSPTTEPMPKRTRHNEMIHDGHPSYLDSTSIINNHIEIPTLAKAWGEKLLELDPQQRAFAEKAINDILFEASQGTLQRHSVQIN